MKSLGGVLVRNFEKDPQKITESHFVGLAQIHLGINSEI